MHYGCCLKEPRRCKGLLCSLIPEPVKAALESRQYPVGFYWVALLPEEDYVVAYHYGENYWKIALAERAFTTREIIHAIRILEPKTKISNRRGVKKK